MHRGTNEYVARVPRRRRAWHRRAATAGSLMAPGLVAADYRLNLPPPATSIAERILDLHNLVLIICAAIFVIVFAVMFYSIIVHRRSRGYKAAAFHENAKLELLWTVVPFLILFGLAIPSTTTLIAMSDVSKSDLTVYITGYQWKWKYDFPEHDIGYFSVLSTPREQIEGTVDKGEHYLLEVDNPLVLPVGKKVRLIVTANDVLHAWWVPQLGIKKDAIPGYINEAWMNIDKPGVYRGQCAELCGKDHGFMPVVVNAVTPEEFDKWVVAQKQKAVAAVASTARAWTRDELIARGKQVYQVCAVCHGPNGEGVATFPKLAGGKITTGPLSEHLEIVLRGKPGTVMQAFAAQLNDADIAAVITYERSSFGNKAGDVVQPAQVKAAR